MDNTIIKLEKDETSPEFVTVKQPGKLKSKNVTDNTELYIFRIPKGLFDVKDLVNQQITIGSKRPSKVTINDKDYEFVTRPLNGQDTTPWLPNSKGIFKPVQAPVLGEVCARIQLARPAHENLADGLGHLAPVTHIPPLLPQRDFFGSFAETFAKKGKSDELVEVRKSKKKKLSGTTSKQPSSKAAVAAAPAATIPSTVRPAKRKMSLEEITPEIAQRPFKKQKTDKLVANFKNVFDDICMTPAPSGNKANNTNNSEGEANTGDKSKKKKNKKSVDLLNLDLNFLSQDNGLAPETNADVTNSKKKKKRKSVAENGLPAADDSSYSQSRPKGLQGLYLTQSTNAHHKPKAIKSEPMHS